MNQLYKNQFILFKILNPLFYRRPFKFNFSYLEYWIEFLMCKTDNTLRFEGHSNVYIYISFLHMYYMCILQIIQKTKSWQPFYFFFLFQNLIWKRRVSYILYNIYRKEERIKIIQWFLFFFILFYFIEYQHNNIHSSYYNPYSETIKHIILTYMVL